MNKIIKQAFTLIELLVVIAIIGILSGLIVITMSRLTSKANVAKGQIFNNSLRNTLMLNLVAEYKLDGNAIDSWGSHAAGTISGASSFSSCPQNTCYSFDGTDDYIELPDAADLRMVSGGTISAWINPKSSGEGYGRIVDKSTSTSGASGYIFYLDNSALCFNINGVRGFCSSTGKIAYNQWQLATITFNNLGASLYVNGVKVNVDNSTAMPPDVSRAVRIGQRSGGDDRTFDGYIDEARFFNALIPTSQIKEQYCAGLNQLLAKGSITQEEYSQRVSELAKK